MTFTLVHDLRAELLRLPPLPAGAPLAQMATGLSARVHGAPRVVAVPELVNVGAALGGSAVDAGRCRRQRAVAMELTGTVRECSASEGRGR